MLCHNIISCQHMWDHTCHHTHNFETVTARAATCLERIIGIYDIKKDIEQKEIMIL